MSFHRKAVALGVIALSTFTARPVQAGLMDWWRSTTRPTVKPEVAQGQVKRYLERVIKREDFKIAGGRSALSGSDRKQVDAHVGSRLEKLPELAIADVSARGAKGVAVLAGHGLSKGEWDPAKGYVGYLSLEVAEPFPTEADRALETAGRLIGEAGMFGFSPEAGPLWKVTERYLVGNLPGADGAAHVMGSDSASREASGSGHHGEDIPAWVVRGWTDLVWKGVPKPLDMGVLIALTRERGGKSLRLAHVTGVGSISKGLFHGGIRLNKEDEEE